jgi:hypothetical protein
MRSGAEEQRSAAGGEALMGFGMAAMAVPAAVFTPPSWAWSVYAAVFGAAGVHALWAARAGAHHLHHLVGAAAMVYMSVVMAGSPAHAHGRGGSGVPLLTGAAPPGGVTGRNWRGPAGCPWGSRWWRCCWRFEGRPARHAPTDPLPASL